MKLLKNIFNKKTEFTGLSKCSTPRIDLFNTVAGIGLCFVLLLGSTGQGSDNEAESGPTDGSSRLKRRFDPQSVEKTYSNEYPLQFDVTQQDLDRDKLIIAEVGQTELENFISDFEGVLKITVDENYPNARFVPSGIFLQTLIDFFFFHQVDSRIFNAVLNLARWPGHIETIPMNQSYQEFLFSEEMALFGPQLEALGFGNPGYENDADDFSLDDKSHYTNKLFWLIHIGQLQSESHYEIQRIVRFLSRETPSNAALILSILNQDEGARPFMATSKMANKPILLPNDTFQKLLWATYDEVVHQFLLRAHITGDTNGLVEVVLGLVENIALIGQAGNAEATTRYLDYHETTLKNVLDILEKKKIRMSPNTIVSLRRGLNLLPISTVKILAIHAMNAFDVNAAIDFVKDSNKTIATVRKTEINSGHYQTLADNFVDDEEYFLKLMSFATIHFKKNPRVAYRWLTMVARGPIFKADPKSSTDFQGFRQSFIFLTRVYYRLTEDELRMMSPIKTQLLNRLIYQLVNNTNCNRHCRWQLFPAIHRFLRRPGTDSGLLMQVFLEYVGTVQSSLQKRKIPKEYLSELSKTLSYHGFEFDTDLNANGTARMIRSRKNFERAILIAERASTKWNDAKTPWNGHLFYRDYIKSLEILVPDSDGALKAVHADLLNGFQSTKKNPLGHIDWLSDEGRARIDPECVWWLEQVFPNGSAKR